MTTTYAGADYPALPATTCGMAGYGVPSPDPETLGDDYLSDGYDTPEDAVAAAQAAVVYIRGGMAPQAAREEASTMMDDGELGEWSDLSKDLYGTRIRSVAGLRGVRNGYWARRYAVGPQGTVATGDGGYE